MKTIYTYIIRILSVTFIIIISSCNPFQMTPGADELNQGEITFIIESDALLYSSRTSMPSSDNLSVDRFDYTLTNTSTGELIEETYQYQTSHTVSLDAGTWNLEVFGYNNYGTNVIEGSKEITVLSGETNSFTITLNPVSGTGSYTIYFTWPETEVPSGTITAVLTDLSDDSTEDISSVLDVDCSNGIADTFPISCEAGNYLLTIELKDSEGRTAAYVVESVMIFANLSTSINVFLDTGDIRHAPQAPTGLSVSLNASTQPELNWTDNSNIERGFRIERKLESGSYSEIHETGANVTTYTDTTAMENNTYVYRVSAVNDFGGAVCTIEPSITVLPTVEAPVPSKSPGTYNGPVLFTLSSATPDATVYYTIDGTEPTIASTAYSGETLTFASTSRLRAIAVAPDHIDSQETDVEFTIALDEIEEGFYTLPFSSNSGGGDCIAVSGNTAFVSNYDGIISFDITNPGNPSIIGFYDEYSIEGLDANLNYLYAVRNGDLIQFGISDPANLDYDQKYDTTSVDFHDVHVTETNAYVAAEQPIYETINGLYIFDSPLTFSSFPDYQSGVDTNPDHYTAEGVYYDGTYTYTVDSMSGGLNIITSSTNTWQNSLSNSGSGEDLVVYNGHAYVVYYNVDVYNVSSVTSTSYEGSLTLPTGTSPTDVELNGAYLYVAYEGSASKQPGVRVFDLSTSATAPTEVSTIDTVYTIRDLRFSGNNIYATSDEAELIVIDYSTPSSPAILSTVSQGQAQAVDVYGTMLYLADAAGGVRSFDTASPGSGPLWTADVPNAVDVVAQAAYLFVADLVEGLKVLNASNGTVISEVNTGPTMNDYCSIAYTTNYAYLGGSTGIEVYNVGTPSAPSLVTTLNTEFSNVTQLVANGSDLYVVDGSTGFHHLDISTPSSPSLITTYSSGGWQEAIAVNSSIVCTYDDSGSTIRIYNRNDDSFITDFIHSSANRIWADEYYLYVDETHYLNIYDITDPNNPVLVVTDAYVTDGNTSDIIHAGDYLYFASTRTNAPIFTLDAPW
ncbi:MAG: chitobiase/beta-hexosaminidase C-terminal domain-containing protein [Spirochaetia bacterium]